jgi:hypothetical protein
MTAKILAPSRHTANSSSDEILRLLAGLPAALS